MSFIESIKNLKNLFIPPASPVPAPAPSEQKPPAPSEPRYDLARWRADQAALTVEIKETKRAARAALPAAPTGRHEWWIPSHREGCPDCKDYQERFRTHQIATRNLPSLKYRATALYTFRASLRGKVHNSQMDADERENAIAAMAEKYLMV